MATTAMEPQQQPSSGREKNENANTSAKRIENFAEITIAPTSTHLAEQTASIQPIQPRTLTMNKRLERQKFSEEKTRSTQFRGHPNYDCGLQYMILPEGNVYKGQSYNSKLRTYRLKNIALQYIRMQDFFEFVK